MHRLPRKPGQPVDLIFTADDFGLSVAVNEAVECAYRHGVLTHASIMVTGDAASDAVARARSLPGLEVGLHLVVVDGPAVLPSTEIPDLLVGGRFPADELRLGLRYALLPHVRRQLAAEIDAQFAAFARTGLPLSHADAHRHMHLHPVVGRMMLQAGGRYGLRRLRVPSEPPATMRRLGEKQGLGARSLHAWTGLLRRSARSAGMQVPDQVFGIAWTGHMTESRVLRLLDALPPGRSEIYFHPATRRDPVLDRLMPRYEHSAELAALLSPRIRARVAAIRRAAPARTPM